MPPQTHSARPVACQICHRRKVKCSGSHPCTNCRQAGHPEDCVYPQRDRQVRVSQGYVESIVKENERLRKQLANPDKQAKDAATHAPPPAKPNDGAGAIESQETPQNPLVEDRAWFMPVAALDTPIHIGEASDAAFTTRVRQSLAGGSASHIPRRSFVTDEQLLSLASTDCPWPSAARARLFIRVAFETVCKYYHMVRRSVVLENLESALKDPRSCDQLKACRLFALFALGELHTSRAVNVESRGFPGLQYFAKARRMAGVAVERPRLENIEVMMLFASYSYSLNRRHSAYLHASSAVRQGLVMGLHLNVPEGQGVRSREEREHRVRIWWTAYILDRGCSTKIGHSVSIQNDDIHIDLPSDHGLNDSARDDFPNSKFILRQIELARLEERVIVSIYTRRKHQDPFSQRVQHVLKDLTRWVESSPPEYQLGQPNETLNVPNHVVRLHLSFNQCVILATRPILLHTFRTYKESLNETSSSARPHVPESAQPIVETCIQTARHSIRLLTEAWIAGSFSIYGYPYTQWLFSSSTILAISSLLDRSGSRNDRDSFMNGVQFLYELRASGNNAGKTIELCRLVSAKGPAAHEYCQHIDAMKATIAAVMPGKGFDEETTPPTPLGQTPYHDPSMAHPDTTVTAGMALTDESLQALLSQPLLDLEQYDTSTFLNSNGMLDDNTWGDVWWSAGL